MEFWNTSIFGVLSIVDYLLSLGETLHPILIFVDPIFYICWTPFLIFFGLLDPI